jgi:hypothetical protein
VVVELRGAVHVTHGNGHVRQAIRLHHLLTRSAEAFATTTGFKTSFVVSTFRRTAVSPAKAGQYVQMETL